MTDNNAGLQATLEGALSKVSVESIAAVEESLSTLQAIFQNAADGADDNDTASRMTGAAVGVAASRILIQQIIGKMTGGL